MKRTIKILAVAAAVTVLIPFFAVFGSKTIEYRDAMYSSSDMPELREGDIIFQTSKSDQSKYIQLATGSNLSHCGIIVKVGKEYKVLEASRTVRLTNLKDFIARGKDGRFWIKRADIGDKKIRYNRYLGKRYDLAFCFDNNKYYCSELVYIIYKDQLGINLCEPQTVESYCILGLDKILKDRGINTKQKVVAPSDIYRSELLEDI